ncbi:hypothetical protein XAUC_04100 [Xanthomonas citri pv. aurantifolii str. ICPB 10535]|nr:hypothetical protein XAUC_04100 [Xanthomonas citri pv. aurantifolii str. ICPB 10535]
MIDALQRGVELAAYVRIQFAAACGQCGVVTLGTALQARDRLIQCSEIDLRHRRFRLGRTLRPVRVIHRRVGAGLQQLGLRARRSAVAVCLLFELLRITGHRIGEVAETLRQHRCVGDAQDRTTHGLRQQRQIGELRIDEACGIIVGVVQRVIDTTASALPAVAQIQRGQSQMLQKRAVVAARTERLERNVAAGRSGFCDVLLRRLGGGCQCVDARTRALTFEHAYAAVRVLHVGRHAIDQALQRVTAAGVEKAASIAVGVDIQHRFASQLVGVLLGPFGGAEQAGFFAIPAGVHQRALGTLTLFGQLANRLGFGQQRGGAR